MKLRWNQIAVSVAAGFLMGALFSDLYHVRLKGSPAGPVPEGKIEVFTRELGLSRSQQERTMEIFTKYRPKVRKVSASIRPQLEDLRAQIMAELKTVLTPEQYERLDRLDRSSQPPEDPPPHRR